MYTPWYSMNRGLVHIELKVHAMNHEYCNHQKNIVFLLKYEMKPGFCLKYLCNIENNISVLVVQEIFYKRLLKQFLKTLNICIIPSTVLYKTFLVWEQVLNEMFEWVWLSGFIAIDYNKKNLEITKQAILLLILVLTGCSSLHIQSASKYLSKNNYNSRVVNFTF